MDWINVNDRMPEFSGYTIVYCKCGRIPRVSFAKYQKRLNQWELTGARSYWIITHWMPLPEPPKNEDEV